MPRPRSASLGRLYDQFVSGDPEQVMSYERALSDSEVASALYTIRIEAGLSQREIAALVGTTASVICRLEDTDYRGHSLSMLRRVAAVLGRRVEIRFSPATETMVHRESSVGNLPHRRISMQVFVCGYDLRQFETQVNEYLSKGYRMIPGTFISDSEKSPTFMVFLEGTPVFPDPSSPTGE